MYFSGQSTVFDVPSQDIRPQTEAQGLWYSHDFGNNHAIQHYNLGGQQNTTSDGEYRQYEIFDPTYAQYSWDGQQWRARYQQSYSTSNDPNSQWASSLQQSYYATDNQRNVGYSSYSTSSGDYYNSQPMLSQAIPNNHYSASFSGEQEDSDFVSSPLEAPADDEYNTTSYSFSSSAALSNGQITSPAPLSPSQNDYTRRDSIGEGGNANSNETSSTMGYSSFMKSYHYKVPLTDRPFKCDQCPASFNRNHDLKRHKRIHLPVKPFPCPTCDKQFSRKDALKRHILVRRCGHSNSGADSAETEN